MRRIFAFLLTLCYMGVVFAQPMKPVKVTSSFKVTSKDEGVITFVATIDNGWHMYSTEDVDGPTPTTLTVEKISGAAPDFQVDDAAVAGQVEVHSGIDNLQGEAVLAAEEIDAAGSLRMGEMAHLLPGHFLRGDADAFFNDAVVACEDNVLGMAERRAQGLLDESDLKGERFEPPERPFRFCKIIYIFLQGRPDCLIGPFDMECDCHIILLF